MFKDVNHCPADILYKYPINRIFPIGADLVVGVNKTEEECKYQGQCWEKGRKARKARKGGWGEGNMCRFKR